VLLGWPIFLHPWTGPRPPSHSRLPLPARHRPHPPEPDAAAPPGPHHLPYTARPPFELRRVVLGWTPTSFPFSMTSSTSIKGPYCHRAVSPSSAPSPLRIERSQGRPFHPVTSCPLRPSKNHFHRHPLPVRATLQWDLLRFNLPSRLYLVHSAVGPPGGRYRSSEIRRRPEISLRHRSSAPPSRQATQVSPTWPFRPSRCRLLRAG
jgi:hypothetical protein